MWQRSKSQSEEHIEGNYRSSVDSDIESVAVCYLPQHVFGEQVLALQRGTNYVRPGRIFLVWCLSMVRLSTLVFETWAAGTGAPARRRRKKKKQTVSTVAQEEKQ